MGIRTGLRWIALGLLWADGAADAAADFEWAGKAEFVGVAGLPSGTGCAPAPPGAELVADLGDFAERRKVHKSRSSTHVDFKTGKILGIIDVEYELYTRYSEAYQLMRPGKVGPCAVRVAQRYTLTGEISQSYEKYYENETLNTIPFFWGEGLMRRETLKREAIPGHVLCEELQEGGPFERVSWSAYFNNDPAYAVGDLKGDFVLLFYDITVAGYVKPQPIHREGVFEEILLAAAPISKAEPNAKLPVTFLPGIAGSRLQSAKDTQEVWPSGSAYSPDSLLMTGSGQSKHEIRATSSIGNLLPAIGDVYDSFFDFMEEVGYEEGEWLFDAPYDWRYSPNRAETLASVQEQVKTALKKTGRKKVVLVAHSMGGLVARAYLRRYGTGQVDKLITMGTPHRGAPKAYYALMMGYTFGNPFFNENRMKIVARHMPSAFSLQPWGRFVRERSSRTGGEQVDWTLEETYRCRYHSVTLSALQGVFGMRISEDHPWAPDLTLLGRARVLRTDLGTRAPEEVETFTIIGYGSATATGYVALHPDKGKPGILHPSGRTYHLYPVWGDGDSTVPRESAEGLEGDLKLYVQHLPDDSASHGVLAANKRIQLMTYSILEGQLRASSNGYTKPKDLKHQDELTLEIFCPADLHVYDSQNRHMGLNEHGAVEELIPGGSHLVMEDVEYAAIHGATGSYRVRIEGLEDGKFTLNLTASSGGRERALSFADVPLGAGESAEFAIPSVAGMIDDPPDLLLPGGRTVPGTPLEPGESGSRGEPPTGSQGEAGGGSQGGSPMAGLDLTGRWSVDGRLAVAIRQIGGDVFWGPIAGEATASAHVFVGRIDGDVLAGRWVDLPGNPALGQGTLRLRIESQDRMVNMDPSSTFAGKVWIRRAEGAGYPGVVEQSPILVFENDVWKNTVHTHVGCSDRREFCKEHFIDVEMNGSVGSTLKIECPGLILQGKLEDLQYDFLMYREGATYGRGRFTFSPNYSSFEGTFEDDYGHRGTWTGSR